MKKAILTAAVFLMMAVPAMADTIKGYVWVNVTDSQALTIKTEKGLTVVRYLPSKTCTPVFYRPNDEVKIDYHFDEKTKSNVADSINIVVEATDFRRVKPIDTIEKEDFLKIAEKGTALLLDVRGVPRFKEGAFKGAKNIPFWSLEHRLAELPKDKQIVIYCASGKMSRVAADILKEKGFTNVKFLRMPVISDKTTGGATIVEGVKVKCG